MSLCTACNAVCAVTVPCLLNHAQCNKTRGPCCVHHVWRHQWCLHDVCLASGPLELTTWWTICIALPMNHELYTAMTMASVAFPRSTRDWYCHPCLNSVILRKHYESMVPTIRTIVIPPMFGRSPSIEQLWRRHAHFRVPYIKGVKARTRFLSISFVIASATFWFVLM